MIKRLALSIICFLIVATGGFLWSNHAPSKVIENKPSLSDAKNLITTSLQSLPVLSYMCYVSGYKDEGMGAENCQEYSVEINNAVTGITGLVKFIRENKKKCSADYNLQVLTDLEKVTALIFEIKYRPVLNIEALTDLSKDMTTFIKSIDYDQCSVIAMSF